MRTLSETHALAKLHELKSRFAARIRDEYEHRAKSCATCETPGACCLDAHFVNVRITRLEAVAIREVIDTQVMKRVEETIEKFELEADGDKTYACPLFEKGLGCLVHDRGKPLACVTHACYENKEDLPPDEFLVEQEGLVASLNELTYRKPATLLPLPVAIRNFAAVD